MIKRKTQILNVSSLYSINGDFKSQVNVNIPDCNFSNKNIKSVYFSIQHCEVPNSFYVVNYTNNSLVINSITYTLQRGNYSATTFITYLLTILPVGFGITYSSITNKFTFTYTTNFTINGSHSNSKINKVLGLGTTDITSILNTLTLPNCCNFLPLARLNFRTNVFKFKNYNQNDNSADIVLSLQNNAPQMGSINYANLGQTKFLLEDKAITSFIISVSDDNNQLVNFNGVDWFLTFQIETEYLEEIQDLTFQNLVRQFN